MFDAKNNKLFFDDTKEEVVKRDTIYLAYYLGDTANIQVCKARFLDFSDQKYEYTRCGGEFTLTTPSIYCAVEYRDGDYNYNSFELIADRDDGYFIAKVFKHKQSLLDFLDKHYL